MPGQNGKPRPERPVRDVVFVDGVRTPFGILLRLLQFYSIYYSSSNNNRS